MKKVIKAAFSATIPVLLGYVSIGIAFGLLFQKAGYHAGWAFLMSLIVYAGAMQFISVSFFSGGISLLGVALMTLVVNVRHIFYGLSFLEKFADMGWKKWYMAFALSDETYSLLCSAEIPEDINPHHFYLVVAMMDQSYWLIGSVIGSVAGSLLTFDTTGMDFAMTALFIVIFLDQWQRYSTHWPALIGLSCTVVALLIFGAENLAIPAMFLISLVLLLSRRWIEPKLRLNEEDKTS